MSGKSTRGPKRPKRQPTGDYASGYCRTPEHSRFKKGEPSRNPSGRRPRSNPDNPAALVNQAARTLLPISDDGADATIMAHEGLLLQLFTRAIKGDRKAAAELLKTRLKYLRMKQVPTDGPPAPIPVYAYADGRLVSSSNTEAQSRVRKRPGRISMKQRLAEGRRQIFDRVSQRIVSMPVGKQTERMSLEAALWRSLYRDALKGDSKATALVMRFGDAIGHSGVQTRTSDCIDENGVLHVSFKIGDRPVDEKRSRMTGRIHFLDQTDPDEDEEDPGSGR